jgi:hypothetical protein
MGEKEKKRTIKKRHRELNKAAVSLSISLFLSFSLLQAARGRRVKDKYNSGSAGRITMVFFIAQFAKTTATSVTNGAASEKGRNVRRMRRRSRMWSLQNRRRRPLAKQ